MLFHLPSQSSKHLGLNPFGGNDPGATRCRSGWAFLFYAGITCLLDFENFHGGSMND